MDLMELPVILVDCQTTGSTPPGSQIIEIGWIAARGCELSRPNMRDVNVTFCGLHPGNAIPRRISTITGITSDDVRDAPSPGTVWKRFCASCRGGGAHGPYRFLVVHHAQFEERFLRSLHGDVYPGRPFPFRFICTRQIACHLHPALPRRSLRAVTGLLGCEPGELRRSGDHVRATASLWVHYISLLRDRYGITDVNELNMLLMKRPPRNSGKRYPLPRDSRLTLPDAPGVYRFKNPGGSILYIGKARSLKARVNSHFTGTAPRDDMVECLTQVTDIQIRKTPSATEASLLEVEEIADNEPPYNRALRNEGTALWFFSRDFSHFQEQPDADHDRGPFPEHESIERLHTIHLWLSGARMNALSCGRIRTILGLKRNASSRTVREVRHRFVEKHGPPSTIGDLLSAGRRYNSERERSSNHIDGIGSPSFDDTVVHVQVDPDDDPERYFHRLMEMIGVYSRLVFRSRWLSSLVDSVVAWRRNPGNGDRTFRYLVFRSGRVVDSGNADCREFAKTLTPHPRRKVHRLEHLDRIGFTRLRTMNTELKRLVKEDRTPVVYLPFGRPLDTEHLSRILAVM